MPDLPIIKLPPEDVKALQRILNRKGGSPAAVTRKAGVTMEDLARGVVRYVLSAEYKGDLTQVLTSLGLDTGQVLQAAEEVECAWGESSVAERLYKKVGHVLQPGRESAVITWINQLRAGDAVALRSLWSAFYPRIVTLARRRLKGVPKSEGDEEFVALEVFEAFRRSITENRSLRLQNLLDVWNVLVVMIARKCLDLKRRSARMAHGSRGRSRAEGGEVRRAMFATKAREPDPALAAEVAEVAEEHLRLFDRLDDPQLRSLALLKMAGDTNAEIAAKLNCSLRTVERRLNRIRSLLEPP
jgi:DNA-directed RNA polymerase specialized sigma24 family protein